MVRTLFIFSGKDREELERNIADGTEPDTSFFGFNHVRDNPDIEADYIQIKKETFRYFGNLSRKYVFFNTLYLLILYYRKFNKYDVIFLMTSAYLNLLFLRKLGFFRKQKWIVLNIDFTLRTKQYANNALYKNIFLSTINQADKIVCLSKVQTDSLIEQGVKKEKLVFIPLGVDLNFFDQLPEREGYILTVGNDLGRDYKTFLKAMTLIPQHKVVMHCSNKNIEGLEDLVPSNVKILVNKSYLEIRELYENASCFVIAVKPEEELVGSDCSGQTAILDTMAYGRPVIATSSPWLFDYFQEGKNILTVPVGDAKAISEKIVKLFNNKELRESLVGSARKNIEDAYNSKVMGERIGGLILEK